MSEEKNAGLLQAGCGTYFVVFLLSWALMAFWGDYSYKGAAYNAGRALVWPVNIFKSSPKIDGNSKSKFAESFFEVMNNHPDYTEGNEKITESLSYAGYYLIAKIDTTIRLSDYKRFFSSDLNIRDMDKKANDMKKLSDSFFSNDEKFGIEAMKYLDGMDYYDIIKSKKSFKKDIEKLLKKREK